MQSLAIAILPQNCPLFGQLGEPLCFCCFPEPLVAQNYELTIDPGLLPTGI